MIRRTCSPPQPLSEQSSELVQRVAIDCLAHAPDWQMFMEKNDAAFVSRGGDEEHDLTCTEIHQQFQDLVTSTLETHLAEVSHTPETFYQLCRDMVKGGDEDEQQAVTVFVELLLAAVDFLTFSQVMRDRHKRQYYFDILRMWRRSATMATK